MAFVAATPQLSIDCKVAIEKRDTFAIICWRQFMKRAPRKRIGRQTNRKARGLRNLAV